MRGFEPHPPYNNDMKRLPYDPTKEPKRTQDRDARARYYERNKALVMERNRLQVIRVREYVNEIKSTTPCVDCGKTYPPYVMDFHHEGDDKLDNIGTYAHNHGIESVKREIAKCVVLCANCHRERTFGSGLSR